MRLIPGKTKVQIELFKGITVADIVVALVDLLAIVFVLTSTLPGKLFICLGLFTIGAVLLLRMDSEPNYTYLLHILLHFGMPRRYRRKQSEKQLTHTEDEPGADGQENAVPAETPEERSARLKREREEFKEDEKKLKSHKLSKEEEDAIWLKRAQQSARRREEKKSKSGSAADAKASDMADIIGVVDIKDDMIEYSGHYRGVVIEIDPVEFRFFSEYRRANSIENAVGRVLRSLTADYAANIVKIERPVLYDDYLKSEYDKLDSLRASYESGLVGEEELKAKTEILFDRINQLRSICYDDKIIESFFYLVLFDSDRTQLNHSADNALEMLRNGEIGARRLKNRELAVFLKYTNTLDFDEREVDKVDPADYVKWAMPESVSVQARTVNVSGMVTHNMRVISYPSRVNDAWLASALSMSATKVVIKLKPMDRDRAVRGIDRSLQELRGQLNTTGVDSRRIELEDHIATLSDLLSTLQGDNETLLDVNIYVTAYDMVRTRDTSGKKENFSTYRAEINNMKRAVRRAYQENGMRLTGMDFDQLNAFVGSQVSAYDPMSKMGRGIPSNSIAAGYPWIFAHVSDKGGFRLGSDNGVPVFVDFFRRDSERVNSNMVIVGKSGSGKSFATKTILANLAAEDAKIFILDPENEYTELATNLHGKFINVGNAKSGRLNPFHIITALDDDESSGSATSGSYATHLQFLEEFFRQILPDVDKDAMEYLNSLIDRMYANMGITAETDLSKLSPTDYPTFDDLYDSVLNEFQATDNEYIHTILRTLMNYVAKFSEGGRNANIWNGPSTITTNESFTVFNFQSLLSNRNGSIANAQMLLVLKYIDNEIIKNRDYNIKHGLHRKVVVVIDEAHVFIDAKYPIALDFMFQLAKRIRKYNGMQIVITQNIKDFVGSEDIARKSTAIINASQYSFIFALAPNDMADLCKLYEKAGGINEVEQEQIVSAPRGQAFTVLSAQSRSTFRVTAPSSVTEMFEKPTYTSHYFNGESGAQNWEEFMGTSRALHELAVSEIEEGMPVAEQSTEKLHSVQFLEISEEEYQAEQQSALPVQSSTTAEQGSTAASDDGDASDTVVFTEESDVPEESEETGAKTAGQRKAEDRSERDERDDLTRELLEALREERSSKSRMTDSEKEELRREILQSVKEELAQEMAALTRVRESADTDTAGQDAYDVGSSLDSLDAYDTDETQSTYNAQNDTESDDMDFAFLSGYDSDTGTVLADVSDDAEEQTNEPEKTETEESDGKVTEFDFLDMLMAKVKQEDEVSPLEMMVSCDQKTMRISLKDLIAYNAKHI